MRFQTADDSFSKWLLLTLLVLGLFLSPAGYAENAKAVQAGYKTPVYAVGVQAYHNAQYEEAVRAFRAVLAQDSGNINARYYLALSLEALQHVSGAVPEYQAVAEYSQNPKLVAYAQARLKALMLSSDASASSGNPVNMVAAGNQWASSTYRGSASQIAVPLKNSRNALMVDAALTNRKARALGTFIIDTGATYTSISEEMAHQLGLDLDNAPKIRITTANGRIEVPKVMIDTLSVNGLEAHNVEATVIQVRSGSSFHGLLGLSFIRQFVLTIDPQAGQLIFQKN